MSRMCYYQSVQDSIFAPGRLTLSRHKIFTGIFLCLRLIFSSQDRTCFHSLTFSSFHKGFLACHSISGRDTQYWSGPDTSPMTHWRGREKGTLCVSVCVYVCERDRSGSQQWSLQSYNVLQHRWSRARELFFFLSCYSLKLTACSSSYRITSILGSVHMCMYTFYTVNNFYFCKKIFSIFVTDRLLILFTSCSLYHRLWQEGDDWLQRTD